MSLRSVARLSQMSRRELSWRARQAARIVKGRCSAGVRRPRWRRDVLGRVLANGVLDGRIPDPITDPIPYGDAHAELARQLRARRTRFALDPACRPRLRSAVAERWPDAVANAVAHAERILAGRYDLLGYRDLACGSGSAVDWHVDPVHGRRAPLAFWADVAYLDPAVGDHKIIWELNRHQHWLRLGRASWLTGDPRFRRAIVDQLYGWLEANPPLVGINWASMLEIALRSISWVWALHFLLADEGIRDQGSGIRPVQRSSDPGSRIPDPAADRPWLVDMLIGLDRQLTHVEQNLSIYFSPNTHLTGEALALYVTGVALPELAASSRWADTGRRILLAEIEQQIHGDGGHAERSTHYQRYTLDFYLMALLTARRDGDAEAAAMFADAATRLADFTRTIADDHGRLPLIGDDDGGMLWPLTGRRCDDVRDSLALASVLLDRPDLAPWGLQEEVAWLAADRTLADASRSDAVDAGAEGLPSRTLADTGYVVMRDGLGGHAVFDAGAHGYRNGGHAHADALAITLTLDGRPLLVDPGTYTYTMDGRLRDRLRSSMSHNTVTLGGRSQAIPAGPFHWRTRADARLSGCRHNPAFDWVEACHDGYAPARHRRTLLRAPQGGWLVVDEILDTAEAEASAHWHFDPAWTLRCDAPGRLKATHADGGAVWLLHDEGDVWLAHGDEESGLGWFAPVYGTLVPTWSARITRHRASPLDCVTWLAPADGAAGSAPRLERLTPIADPADAAIAVRVIEGSRVSVFLVRPGAPASRERAGCGVLDYQTDGRLLHYAECGRLLTLDLVDASHALALRDGWISVAANEPIRDLHIALGDEIIDVQSSAPPSELQLQGSALGDVRRIRLNQRERPIAMSDRSDSAVIYGVDWTTPSERAPEGAPFAALP